MSARAILALVKIMDNKKVVLRRRIEACQALLEYEAPEQTVQKAKDFLTSIFEDGGNISVDDRLMALKLMRKASAAKVTQASVRAASTDATREIFRQIELAGRRERLALAGFGGRLLPADWADDLLRDDYVAPTDRSLGEVFNGE